MVNPLPATACDRRDHSLVPAAFHMTGGGYAAVFAELKDALRPFRREQYSPSQGEVARLADAVGAARALIESDRLKTRSEAFRHGALRRGTQYLEERDLANLTTAEDYLHNI